LWRLELIVASFAIGRLVPTMKPFIKSAGGKTKMLPQLLSQLPAKIETYVEPFVGGGALFFALAEQKRFKKAILNDTNAELINAYVCVWRSLPALLVQLSRHRYEEAYYYQVREDFNTYVFSKYGNARSRSVNGDVAQAARFIYLNKTCFNGLWRVNSDGFFNVPFGTYKNPTICDVDNLREVSNMLKSIDVSFCNYDFVGTVAADKLGKKDVVYCDPPYDDVSMKKTKSFTKYGKHDFRWIDQEALAEWPCWTMVTNADTKRIRKLYRGHSIEVVGMRRNVNSVAANRGKVNELIIRRRR
jgi:DNA adenine methylase